MDNTVMTIVISVVALGLVIARQVVKRPVSADGKPVVLLVLLLIGVFQLVRFLSDHPVTATAVTMLAASLVLAAGFGALRAYTVRLWRENGVLYRQGNALTVLLWLIAIGVHFGAELLIDGGTSAGGLASAALLLYIAVSFGVQRLVLLSRARSMAVAR